MENKNKPKALACAAMLGYVRELWKSPDANIDDIYQRLLVIYNRECFEVELSGGKGAIDRDILPQ